MSRLLWSDSDMYSIITTFEEEYKLTPVDNNRQLHIFIYDIVEFVDYKLQLFLSSSKLSQIAKLSFDTLMDNNTGCVIQNITVKNMVNTIFDLLVEYV